MSGSDVIIFVKKRPVVVVCAVIALVCLGVLYFRWDEIDASKAAYDEAFKADQEILAIGRPSKALYIGVPYNVTVQGSFPHVMDFMRRLESGRHFARFNTLSFSKIAGADAGGDALSVAMNVELLGTP